MSARQPRRARGLRFEWLEPRRLLATISGTIFEDLDGDGVRDSGEAGLSGWKAFIDSDLDGVHDVYAPATYSNNTPKAIIDQGTITSSVVVAGTSGVVTRVTISIDIDHTWNSDLDVYLIGPTGARAELFTDVGASENGMMITIDDQAAASIATAVGSPITGTYRPEGTLAPLLGTTANGTWRLEVTDDAQKDVGQLNSFSIRISTGEVFNSTGASGAYQLTNLSPGTYPVRYEQQSGWAQTLPASGGYSVNIPSASHVAGGIDFGVWVPPGQISGFVFADYDKDGVKDAGEPGQARWTVYIDSDSDGLLDAGERTVLSAADGSYSFLNVKPGTYTVREILQSGWQQTSPGSGGVVLIPSGAQETAAGGSKGLSRDFSKTGVIVAFEGRDGLNQLRRVRRNALIAGLFDLSRSRDLFSVNGVSLVNIALPAGVDPLKAVDRFSRLSGVTWAQPDYVYEDDPRELAPNDTSYGSQYHHPLMQNNLAWDTTLGDPSIIIAVTDDGVSLAHPDLSPNIWVNSDEIAGNGLDDDENGFVDDRNGWDFSSGDSNPNPVGSDDHGTHVAGIVAARTNNGLGVAGTAGGATIMPIRFYGSGAWTSTVVATSFRYAADNGARIVSTSYSIDSFANDAIFAAGIQYLYDHDVLYLNSAGNNSQLNPARQVFDQGLLVASTTSSDVKSSFSNYGYGIDIAAPGSSIYSTLPNSAYGFKSGTSMATPNAAGVAALIWSAHPTWTRDQVAAQLIGSADNIDLKNPTLVGLLGGGRVNSYRGVTETVAPPKIRSLAGLPAEGSGVSVPPTSFTLDVASIFDPATVNAGSFELRGNGVDNIFGTADDSLVPLTLNTTYRIGTNRLSFTVNSTFGSDTYRFSALPTLKDPFGQSIDGNADGTAGDAFTRTFELSGVSSPYFITVATNQTTTANFGNADTIGPTVLGSTFHYQTGHAIEMLFSESMSSDLSTAHVILQRVGGDPATIAQITPIYDPQTHSVTYTFGGPEGSVLPDGDYVLTLPAAEVKDVFSTPLDGDGDGLAGGDYQFSFFVYSGDANHDRKVNLHDLMAMAPNFGQSGMTFGQGDFNYDGTVNAVDLGILSSKWQQELVAHTEALPPPQTTSAINARTRAPTRLFSDVRSLLA